MKSALVRNTKASHASERPRLSHLEIASEALALWRRCGCPVGLDDQIWLTAENYLQQIIRLKSLKRAKKIADYGASRINSGEMMAELDELYPSTPGNASTAL